MKNWNINYKKKDLKLYKNLMKNQSLKKILKTRNYKGNSKKVLI